MQKRRRSVSSINYVVLKTCNSAMLLVASKVIYILLVECRSLALWLISSLKSFEFRRFWVWLLPCMSLFILITIFYCSIPGIKFYCFSYKKICRQHKRALLLLFIKTSTSTTFYFEKPSNIYLSEIFL